MNLIFILLSVQALLGAFDNLWHHELEAKLPQRVSARRELTLHAWRELIYGIVFIGLGWMEWRGAWALVLAGMLVVELVITLADFLEEDRTRRLPPFERVLHTVLTICYGLFLGLFAPVLLGWFQQDSALAVTPHGWVSWLFTAYGVGVLAWSLRNALAVVKLGRLAGGSQRTGTVASQSRSSPAPDASRQARAPVQPAVLVTGATGFIGSALVASLREEGRRLILLSRDARQVKATYGADVQVVESLDDIPSETRIDTIVNLAGARVLGQPWTATRRRELLASRVGVTDAVVRLAQRLQQSPRVLVSASAVGYYGAPSPESVCHEEAPARLGEFQSDLCVAIERAARRAEDAGLRVVCLRFGIVLGRDDGAYPMLALSARLGLGAVLGSGRQPAPWIHLEDAVGLIRFALSNDRLDGPVNAVAPDVPTQAQFARAMAASFGRRVWMRMPAAPLRALAGEMSTLLLDGQRAEPRAALAAGYAYRHPGLPQAMAALAGRAVPCPPSPVEAKTVSLRNAS